MAAATGYAPITITLDSPSGSSGTHALLVAVLRAREHISDVIFSPGRPPQVEVHGHLIPVALPGGNVLTADDTRRIASDLIANNKAALNMLREQGSCDVSYGIPGLARFRVNVFIQRGSCAVVMRVIPTQIPTFASLGLPPALREIAGLSDGIVLVTGPRGSGKSSTLAALLDGINEQQTCHILTIEDPIEFLHNHKKATVHQRELHSDAPSYAQALRAAMRQAPKVIFVGEAHDPQTFEILLQAAETGHLVLTSVNTVDSAKTLERIIYSFPATEQPAIRSRLAKSLRHVICQRLLPRAGQQGRVAAFETLRMTSAFRRVLEQEEHPERVALQFLKEDPDMQDFDSEIESLVRSGAVEPETGLLYATDPQELRRALETHPG